MATFKGDLYLAKLPTGSETLHLCITITDEGGLCSTAFVVPVITPTDKSDKTTIIPTSICPDFLKYDSCVAYNHMVERESHEIEKLIVKRFYPINDELILNRIITGAFNSKLIPKGVRQRLKERLQDE